MTTYNQEKYPEELIGLSLFSEREQTNAHMEEAEVAPIIVTSSSHQERPRPGRKGSEDAGYYNDALGVYMVLDGVGGSADGGFASTTVRDELAAFLSMPVAQARLNNANNTLDDIFELLDEAVNTANAKLDPALNVATTLTLMVKAATNDGTKFIGVNIGDSRPLMDPAPANHPNRRQQVKDLQKRTVDGELVKPDILNELVSDDSNGKYINDAIDGSPRKQPGQRFAVDAVPGARVVLTTDGNTGDWAKRDKRSYKDKNNGNIEVHYTQYQTEFLSQVTIDGTFDRNKTPQQAADFLTNNSIKIDDKYAIVIDVGIQQPIEQTPSKRQIKKAERSKANTHKHNLALEISALDMVRQSFAEYTVLDDSDAAVKTAHELSYLERVDRVAELKAANLTGQEKEDSINTFKANEKASHIKLHQNLITVKESNGLLKLNSKGEAVPTGKARTKQLKAIFGGGAVLMGSVVKATGSVAKKGYGHIDSGLQKLENKLAAQDAAYEARKRNTESSKATKRAKALGGVVLGSAAIVATRSKLGSAWETASDKASMALIRWNNLDKSKKRGAYAALGVAATALAVYWQHDAISHLFNHGGGTPATNPNDLHHGGGSTPSTHQHAPHHGGGGASHEHTNTGNKHGEKTTQHGFNKATYVENGHGYTQEFQDMFKQRGANLSGQQSLGLYNHLTEKFPNLHGNFFTNDHSYVRSQGDYGISHAGLAHWNPAVLHEINHYARENDLLKKTS